MTEKECTKLALEHKETPWIPNKFFEDICFTLATKEGPTGGLGVTTDVYGTKYIFAEGDLSPMPLTSNLEDCVIKDVENWREYVKFPDLDAIDWRKCAETETATWDRENRLTSVVLGYGLLEGFESLAGMETALCSLITDEDAVIDFISAMADHKIALIERYAKFYKPDKITMHDDYANQNALFMKREKWQKMYKPHLKRIVDAVHGLGMYYEHHSCGKVYELFDDFVDIGIDATNPVQTCNKPYEVQLKYEDSLTLIGCADKQGVVDHPDASPQKIEAHLRELVETMSLRKSWISHVYFIEPSRMPIWAKIIDEYNKPRYEKAGVKPNLMMDKI